MVFVYTVKCCFAAILSTTVHATDEGGVLGTYSLLMIIVVLLLSVVIVPSVRLSAVVVALLILRVLIALIRTGCTISPGPWSWGHGALARTRALVSSLIIGALVA